MTNQSTMDPGRQPQHGQQGGVPFPEGWGDDWEYDSRHRNIIGRLDSMIKLLRQYPGRNLTVEIDDLLDAMLDQCCPENSYLELVQFPRAAGHALRHRVICSLAAKLSYRTRKVGVVQVGELEYLRLIWLEHIDLHDRAFEEFLAS